MNRTKIHILIIVLITTGCSVYHPQMIDIPLISSKNDARIDAGVSTSGYFHGTFSYGITDKLAIQTSGSSADTREFYLQQALGFYKKTGENKVLELYAGYGFGHDYAYFDPNPGNLTGKYNLFFTQFNFGRINGKTAHSDIGFGVRAGFMHSNFTDNNYYGRYPVISQGTVIDNSIVIEPNTFLRFGGEKFKISLKLGTCFIAKFTNQDKWLPYEKLNLGVGFNYNF